MDNSSISGIILTSSYGAEWKSQTSGTTSALYGITYGDGQYVAVGAYGTLLTLILTFNDEGEEEWKSETRTSGTTDQLFGVTYVDGQYVVAGYSGTLLTSSDGKEWKSQTRDITTTLRGVAYGNSTYVAVGDGGTISQSVSSTYTVTYDGNGAEDGDVPTDSNTYEQGVTVSVYGNTGNLVKTGYTFAGWNTAADGKGTSYSAGDTFTMGTADVTLYAKWGSETSDPLSAPTNLTATAGDSQVSLTWDSVTEATTYKIYVGTQSGTYGESPTVTVTQATYTVTGLTNGMTYYFVVKASNTGGDSDESNEVSATPQAGVLPPDDDNPPNVRSNANLSSLSLSRGTLNPTFHVDTTSYTASVANSVRSVTVTAEVYDANATLQVNGMDIISGLTSGATL